ncbi:hypothetical protein [Maridesulfovibrio sp.]|uniref:hypothetical protein n=1 Tax=Maridesulfovibrio sp. TaxID=2795000 RepID=UPI003B000CEC
MAKTHKLIVNRLLVDYLYQVLSGDDGNFDLIRVVQILGLPKSDVRLLEKEIKARIKRLEKASFPLGPKISEWREEIETYNAQQALTCDFCGTLHDNEDDVIACSNACYEAQYAKDDD